MACCEVLPSLKEQDQQEFEVKRLLHLVGRAWHRVPKRPRCRGTIRRISHCMTCGDVLPSLNEQDQQEFEVKRLLYLVGRAWHRVPKRPGCRGTIRRISHCMACGEELPSLKEIAVPRCCGSGGVTITTGQPYGGADGGEEFAGIVSFANLLPASKKRVDRCPVCRTNLKAKTERHTRATDGNVGTNQCHNNHDWATGVCKGKTLLNSTVWDTSDTPLLPTIPRNVCGWPNASHTDKPNAVYQPNLVAARLFRCVHFCIARLCPIITTGSQNSVF